MVRFDENQTQTFCLILFTDTQTSAVHSLSLNLAALISIGQ